VERCGGWDSIPRFDTQNVLLSWFKLVFDVVCLGILVLWVRLWGY